MARAKVDFLWYKKRDEIKPQDEDNIPSWIEKGLVEEVKKAKPVSTEKPTKSKKSKK